MPVPMVGYSWVHTVLLHVLRRARWGWGGKWRVRGHTVSAVVWWEQSVLLSR